jgi:hypothetical protein
MHINISILMLLALKVVIIIQLFLRTAVVLVSMKIDLAVITTFT